MAGCGLLEDGLAAEAFWPPIWSRAPGACVRMLLVVARAKVRAAARAGDGLTKNAADSGVGPLPTYPFCPAPATGSVAVPPSLSTFSV